MKIITNRRLKYYIIVALSLFFLASAPIEFGKEEAFFHGYLIKTPIIRVGLGVNLSDIKICSSSGMKIYEVNPNYKLLAEDEDEVFIKGRKEKLNEKFVIQVFQTKDREKAEKGLKEFQRTFSAVLVETLSRESYWRRLSAGE